jgi:glycosyltransferase involved in cell wall biosynthesis
MSAGLPIIASDFKLWREIVVDEVGCGLVVDPLDSKAIADAIRYLFDNPDKARIMGEKGREAVKRKYNWDVEFKKLLAYYKSIRTIH